MSARQKRITIVGVALFLSGCFRYVPAELSTLPPGDKVRVELTRVGFAQLPELPNNSGPDLDGTLLSRENDRLFLRVPVNVHVSGYVTQTLIQDVIIPAADIVQLERRLIDRTRTGASIGLGVATLAVIFLSFHNSPDNPPELDPRIPEEEAGVGLRAPHLPGWSISVR